MQCEHHKNQRALQDEIRECNDCRIESWLLELTSAILELRQAVAESVEFVKDSKSYQNWARLEALDKSLKGFIDYAAPKLYGVKAALKEQNKQLTHTGGIE